MISVSSIMKDLAEAKARSFKILVLEKQSLVRMGICAALNKENYLDVIAEYNSMGLLLKFSTEIDIDLLIIDHEIIGHDYLSEIKKIKDKFTRSKILITTLDSSIDLQLNYFLTGCSGVFYKILDGSFLVKAVKTILCDDLWFERKILNSLAAGYDITQSSGNINSKTIDVKIEALTPREKCIVCYAIQGLPAKRIAQKVHIQTPLAKGSLGTGKPLRRNRITSAR